MLVDQAAFFKLAGNWLFCRQYVLHDGELPFGFNLAGMMVGMTDYEAEMGCVMEEEKEKSPPPNPKFMSEVDISAFTGAAKRTLSHQHVVKVVPVEESARYSPYDLFVEDMWFYDPVEHGCPELAYVGLKLAGECGEIA